MQKIMFNDQYGLTQAVIDGRKTMTRRIITGRLATHLEKYEEVSKKGLLLIPKDVIPDNMSPEEFVKAWIEYKSPAVVQIAEENATKIQPLNDEKMKEFLSGCKYKVGEVVAVAQSYKTLGYTKQWVEQHITPNPNAKPTDPFEKKYPGWNNKMFTPSELNNVRKIQITDVRIERLQNISVEDCMKEGIFRSDIVQEFPFVFDVYGKHTARWRHPSPREAYAALIDKMSGRGTWESNPFVFVYTFKLIK